jgi:hypothetical protein
MSAANYSPAYEHALVFPARVAYPSPRKRVNASWGIAVCGTTKRQSSSGDRSACQMKGPLATRSEAYVQEDINGRTLFIP